MPEAQVPPQYTTRLSGSYAVCFHCRCRIRRQQRRDWPIGENRGVGDPYGEFPHHNDVQRYSRLGEDGETARPGSPRLAPEGTGEFEKCPGSGTMPIPLAYKFPDGGRIPRYN